MKLLLTSLLVAFLTSTIFAQTTSIRLSTSDSLSDFRVLPFAGNSLLKITGDGGFCLLGNTTVGIIPATGGGGRLMWYPPKKAFRAGFVSSTQWDDINIGNYSTATGGNTIASNDYSFASGLNTTASGYASTAMGELSVASGTRSTAIGWYSVASAIYSTAIGLNDTASGDYSIAMGNRSRASGSYSTAMGYGNLANALYATVMGMNSAATGFRSIAMGFQDTASAPQTVAIGSYVTAGYNGSCIIGDNSTISTQTSTTGSNQMMMRFSGGYRLYSSDDLSTYVSLAGAGNAWVSSSDSTKKTNFVKADGEYFLNSISNLRLGSWNYKSQDAKEFRHYGPMAQEIFRYFGKDSYGTIGNDTTLATADMDGIMMICLQALEKRTSELQKANEKIAQLEKLVNEQNAKLQAQQTSFDEFKNELVKIKADVKSLAEVKTDNEKTNITLNK
jgi:hypothetical protein